MSNRNQSDTIIDDDDEFCPLCIEEFDLSDKNFKPCPCGYQICQFCYNNIKTHSEEGRCPNCRRVYDESTIQYKVPDAEEFKADLALKNRKAAAAKKKEAEKRELENSSRKNLAGVRVVQKNLVYVIGLNPSIRDESQLLQTLRGRDYFGQYGDIDKIVVSKAKPGGNPNQGIGVYVTFASRADAATCIAAVDGSLNGDRVLRAQYGTTKYCSSFLRNEQCNNRNCTFLHETGDDNDSYSRQDLSSMNTAQRHGYPNGNPLGVGSQYRPLPHPMHITQTLRRQASKEDEGGNRNITDGSALPSSASWANKDAPINRARRVSLSESRSTPSPKTVHVTVSSSKSSEKQPPPETTSQRSTPASRASTTSTPQQNPQPHPPIKDTLLDNLLRAINSPSFKFVFSTTGLSSEDLKSLEVHPSFIDPYGGVKRRAMREKAEQERVKQETEAQALLHQEESNREGGSLQLGGEPDDSHPSQAGVGGRSREFLGAIQPPSQQGTATNSAIGSPVSISHQFQNLNLGQRSLTPLQQQQLLLNSATSSSQGGLIDHFPSHMGSTVLDQPVRQGVFAGHMSQGGMPGHTRQSSRFSFASDSNAKSNSSNPRMLSQMQSGTPNPLNISTTQSGLANNHFYTSSVQGPPPGLKTAGTPPISGGGMFAQGHGFTSNANLGLNMGKQDNPELMREILRSRSGTSGAGGIQSHEAAKREFMFPFLQQHPTPPPLTAATGLLSSLYGPPSGNFTEPGPQKQKKKGKKHRHANTSSGGGGVDLADPSILQGRIHQVGANAAAAGQGLYGSQTQVDEVFPPLGAPRREKPEFPFRPHDPQADSFRSGTPTLPPGLPLPHGHPAAVLLQDESNPQSPASTTSFLTRSAAAVSRHSTPISNTQDGSFWKSTLPEEPLTDPRPSTRPKNFVDISLGSPQKRMNKWSGIEAESEDQNISSKAPAASADKENSKEEMLSERRLKPIKLAISTTKPSESRTKAKEEHSLSIQASGTYPGSSTAQARDSRPNTPLTGSDLSAPRQPRVLRVIDTPKTGTPPPPQSAATSSVSSAAALKALARRSSASSFSRPATPADLGSDYEPGTSASVSRANSPPPSRFGSAPIRVVTKSQVKKDRKLKAKQTEGKKGEVAIPDAVAEETIQAPIVGRKRKAKKTSTPVQSETPTVVEIEPASTVTSGSKDKVEVADATEPARVPEQDSLEKGEAKFDADKKVKLKKTVREAKPTLAEEKEPVAGTEHQATEKGWKNNNTLEQLIHDAEAMNASIKDLFLERTSPLQVLLSQLHKTGHLELNTHPLFNPPNLNQRTDMKCTEADYVTLKFPIELNEKHRQQLQRGEPVRLDLKPGQLKGRCLITPRGSVLRHLSAEDESRCLTLEKSLNGLKDILHDYPAMSVTEPDLTNRVGGLDAVFATPDKFNIRWVTNNPLAGLTGPRGSSIESNSSPNPTSSSTTVPPNVFSAIDSESSRNQNWAIANTAELVDAATASARDFAEATAKHMLGAAAGGHTPTGPPTAFDLVPDLKDAQSLSDEELRALIESSQRELEQSRKEFDAMDKKLITLVKRNKKLAQQAVTTVGS